MNDKLKPCPFCGSLNLRYEQYGGVCIVCNDCGSFGAMGVDDDEAAEKWNRLTKKSAQVSVSQRESTQKKDGQKNKPVFKYKYFPGFGRT